MTSLRRFTLAMLLLGCCAHGQGSLKRLPEQVVADELEGAPTPKRFTYGFRVRAIPLGMLGVTSLERSQSNPAWAWEYESRSSSPRLGVGPALEFRFSPRLSLRTEALYHRFRYERVTNLYAGTDNADTSTDERQRTTTTERTKSTYWDLALTIQVHGLPDNRLWRKLFASGGYTLRNVSQVKTGTEIVFPDGSNDYNERPAVPSRRNLHGVTVGTGFRFIDDFNISITPEVRFTRFFGTSFQADGLATRKHQLEVGVAFTF
jgi:hypothetical protein